MKVGDLIRWESASSDDMDRYIAHYGVIIKMSRTGHRSESAQVLWAGETTPGWIDTGTLEVVSESR